MSITYTTNENTGVKYAYETTSVWNAREKRIITQRRYLGRVDPITGEIVPTSGVRGKKKKADDPMNDPMARNNDFKSLYEEACAERDALASELKEAMKRIAFLDKQLKQANKSLDYCEKAIRRFRDSSASQPGQD